MDERPPQFTLRNLLIEVTLIAVTLGVGRVAFFVYEYEDRGDPRILLSLVAILALPALCGAIVGGITGQYVKGAVWGTVTAGVLLLIASLFMPAVQAGELDWGPSWVNASSFTPAPNLPKSPTLNL